MKNFEWHDKGWNLTADILELKLIIRNFPEVKKHLNPVIKKKRAELKKLKEQGPPPADGWKLTDNINMLNGAL